MTIAKDNIQKILPIWQPIGYSTHIIAKKVSDKFGVKTSHTGTLDPMAEGVIIVLLNDMRLKKYEFAAWEKVYEFSICFGVGTDTYDGLGMVDLTDFSHEKIDKNEIVEILNVLEGEYTQEVPPYSAINVEGKPMHWHARNKNLNNIEMPTRSGILRNLKLVSLEEKSIGEVVESVKSNILKVSGDLRQEEISFNWDKFLDENGVDEKVQIAKIQVRTTKGLYIRSLSQNIASALDTVGFVCSLVRLKNGDYSSENSKSLEEIFGQNFEEVYDFESRSFKKD